MRLIKELRHQDPRDDSVIPRVAILPPAVVRSGRPRPGDQPADGLGGIRPPPAGPPPSVHLVRLPELSIQVPHTRTPTGASPG